MELRSKKIVFGPKRQDKEMLPHEEDANGNVCIVTKNEVTGDRKLVPAVSILQELLKLGGKNVSSDVKKEALHLIKSNALK